MTIHGIFFDFGFVLAYPLVPLDRRYFYLDWDGVGSILHDPVLVPYLRPGVDSATLTAFFDRELYRVFVDHEQTDGIDPRSNTLLLNTLQFIFDCPITQRVVDRLLTHIDTMKYFSIDAPTRQIVTELKRRNMYLAIVSNMMLPGALLQNKLHEAGLLTCFDTIVVSSDIGYIKPRPEIFQHALLHSGLNPDDVLFVGDSYRQDILGAQRVGLKTVWLNTRHEAQAIAADNRPDYEIATLSEVLELSNRISSCGSRDLL